MVNTCKCAPINNAHHHGAHTKHLREQYVTPIERRVERTTTTTSRTSTNGRRGTGRVRENFSLPGTESDCLRCHRGDVFWHPTRCEKHMCFYVCLCVLVCVCVWVRVCVYSILTTTARMTTWRTHTRVLCASATTEQRGASAAQERSLWLINY